MMSIILVEDHARDRLYAEQAKEVSAPPEQERAGYKSDDKKNDVEGEKRLLGASAGKFSSDPAPHESQGEEKDGGSGIVQVEDA